ncbi:type II toxin-antitoxin system tRNA(fMet)-specific endonuclease VapC [Campylobacter concisus]|uniref:type II toxin-antitoxin system tRNA(fMet)-specific endonuclease VapC n=1 Tax=Campylobacter concisus TaxID=199 RepID=UPI00122C6F55|nr:type II toxin-antitoxin system VapC family toxin [Campylobacter concisus]
MFLLDTNICSYLVSNAEPYSQNILGHLTRYGKKDIFISSITVAEMFYGIENSTQKELNLKLMGDFISNFGVLDFTSKNAASYGKIRLEMKNKNRRIGDMDMLIAAVALSNDLVLVTNNEKDFKDISELRMENWSV